MERRRHAGKPIVVAHGVFGNPMGCANHSQSSAWPALTNGNDMDYDTRSEMEKLEEARREFIIAHHSTLIERVVHMAQLLIDRPDFWDAIGDGPPAIPGEYDELVDALEELKAFREMRGLDQPQGSSR